MSTELGPAGGKPYNRDLTIVSIAIGNHGLHKDRLESLIAMLGQPLSRRDGQFGRDAVLLVICWSAIVPAVSAQGLKRSKLTR